MKIKPVMNRVLIKFEITSEEDLTPTGRGEIVAMGQDCSETEMKIGDTVEFDEFEGHEIGGDNSQLIIVKQENIVCVLPGTLVNGIIASDIIDGEINEA